MRTLLQNYAIRFQAMGCQISTWLTAEAACDARMLQSVAIWFEAWEAEFSRFRTTSALSRLNKQAGQWVEVSPAMFEVIELAIQGAIDTKGLFNPLILPALEAAGYDHSFDADLFRPGYSRPSRAVPNACDIQIERESRRVRLPKNAALDLGGIVKGWAAQQTAMQLAQSGPCLVDAGGDLVAVGSPDDSGGWLVDLPSPFTGKTIGTLLLRDSAVATSGRDYRQWVRDGQSLHHIIDPRTGTPAHSDVISASVIARDGIQAEIWAKAAIIDSVFPALPALIVHSDGTVTHNKEFEGIWSRATQ